MMTLKIFKKGDKDPHTNQDSQNEDSENLQDELENDEF